MNKKTKVIKFKKLNQNTTQHNYIGFYEQNTQNKKEPTFNQIQNKQTYIKPKFINEIEMNQKQQQKEVLLKKEQKQTQNFQQSVKKQGLNQKFQTECYLSDNEQFPLSSIKKKIQPVKLAYPKGYKIDQPIEELRNEIIGSLNKSQSIISIEQIFSSPLMRNILGVFRQEQKSLNFISHQESKEIQHYQNLPQKHQESHVYDHNTQIFNAIQMEQEEMEQNQNWNPLQQNFWNINQQNRINYQNNYHQNYHHQFNINQRNNIYNGTQNFLPSQNTFFQQMNFDSYPLDFDL